MVMRFKNMTVGRRRLTPSILAISRRRQLRLKMWTTKCTYLSKASRVVIALAVIQTARHLRTQILCFRDMSSIAVMA